MAIERPNKNPYSAFNFIVEIDGAQIAAFQEVSGLDSENTPIEYREGADAMNTVRKLPGIEKYPNLTLKRGITGSPALWDWRKEVRDGGTAFPPIRNVDDQAAEREARARSCKWTLTNAWCTKLTGPVAERQGQRDRDRDDGARLRPARHRVAPMARTLPRSRASISSRRPRAPEPPRVRTDVAGFIGFEPRVRRGRRLRCRRPAAPGIRSAVDVPVPARGRRTRGRWSPPTAGLRAVRERRRPIPVAAGQSHASYGARRRAARAGPSSWCRCRGAGGDAGGRAARPTDAAVDRPCRALAVAPVRHVGWPTSSSAARPEALWLTIRPRCDRPRCDDWRDFVLAFGRPPTTARCSARRCALLRQRRPALLGRDRAPARVRRRRASSSGARATGRRRGSSEAEATGLERLLLLDEVTVCRRPRSLRRRATPLPPQRPGPAAASARPASVPCSTLAPPGGAATADRRAPALDPVFDSAAAARAARCS